MHLSVFQKSVLVLAGTTALGIGIAILMIPHAFYASYGIAIGNDASLLSELRAPAAGLATLGLLMLAGIWRQGMAPTSMIMALVVFIAFPIGRVIGLASDGLPSNTVIGALAFELTIAALCIVAFGGARMRDRPAQTTT